MQTPNNAQPQERQTKKILVTVRDQHGRVRWTLATAIKVGNRYHVRESTLNMLCQYIPRGATFTSG
jgi:hypothetical protein